MIMCETKTMVSQEHKLLSNQLLKSIQNGSDEGLYTIWCMNESMYVILEFSVKDFCKYDDNKIFNHFINTNQGRAFLIL